MAKKLKLFNGRNAGAKGHINIAAYSQKQAAELLAEFTGYSMGSLNEIRVYFSPCWGRSMDGIVPTEPCLYFQKQWNDKPIKKI